MQTLQTAQPILSNDSCVCLCACKHLQNMFARRTHAKVNRFNELVCLEVGLYRRRSKQEINAAGSEVLFAPPLGQVVEGIR